MPRSTATTRPSTVPTQPTLSAPSSMSRPAPPPSDSCRAEQCASRVWRSPREISPFGEDSVDCDGVVLRHHAHEVPGETEVRLADVHSRVEPQFAVAANCGRGVEAQGPDPVTDGEHAGYRDVPTGRLDSGHGEGDVRMVINVEEVGRAEVGIALSVLGVDRRRGHLDGATHLAGRGDGAGAGDLTEDTLNWNQSPNALVRQRYGGPRRVEHPLPGQPRVFQQLLHARFGHLL